MAEELRIKGYYSNQYDEGFVSTNMCCRFGMEFFLSQLLFRGDLKRVVYSKEDIAFRRRVETVGKGDVKDGDYNYVNLDLPYAVYSQTGQYEEDDRGSTQNAGQIVLGQIQPDSGIILKAAAIKVKYSATAFYSRRDDINFASQLLYWERTPHFPTYYIVQHELCGWPIDIPVFITLESIDSNVEYEEKQWLEKSKIFPIKCEFTIRSYQTLIETVDNTIELPIRFSGLYGYNKNREVVFTEKTSLIWADSKWSPDEFKEWSAKTPQVDSMGNVIYLPQDYDKNWTPPISVKDPDAQTIPENLINHGLFVPQPIDDIVADSVRGYFNDNRECILDEFHQVDEKTTENSVFIEWKIKEADQTSFDNITIYIPGRVRDQINDVNLNTFEVTDLHPGSKYECTLIITSKSYSKLTYKLTLTTKGEPVLGKKLKDNLIGQTFQEVTTTFTGQSLGKSLIGKEFRTN